MYLAETKFTKPTQNNKASNCYDSSLKDSGESAKGDSQEKKSVESRESLRVF